MHSSLSNANHGETVLSWILGLHKPNMFLISHYEQSCNCYYDYRVKLKIIVVVMVPSRFSLLLRPLSVPFLFRAAGKGTDTATMLRLEKYGRIKFSLWKWTSTDQNALKWMKAYAKGSGTFDGTDFRSFFRSWQLVFWRSSFSLNKLLQNAPSSIAYI